jgi:PKHD-type hydroxylase
MTQPTQYLHIPNLVSEEVLQQIQILMDKAEYIDGKATASMKAKEVKQNLQIDHLDQVNLPQLQNLVLQGMYSNLRFQQVLFPKISYPPVFSKYDKNMTYGWHTDGPIMGQQMPIRTDLAMTLFLSDPDTYEGGELEIQSPTGLVKYKLPKGDAIFYPTTQIHRVAPVTSGTRHVCVSWIQSIIREPQNREILTSLNDVHQNLIQKDIHDENAEQLLQVYSNLMRKWSEV